MLAVIFALCAGLSAQTPAPQTSANPNDPAEMVKQGRALNNAGKQEEALALYARALEKSPDLYDAHLSSGTALDLLGRYEEGRKHLAKAIEVAKPESKVQALKAMAISYAFERKAKNSERFERQAFDIQTAAQDFNAAAETCNELARIYLESGDPANALKWYRMGNATSARKPNLTDAEKDLWAFRWEHAQARIAARRGHREEAQKHRAAAKAILDKGTNPDQTRFFPYLTGYVAFYGGDYKTAIAELQKADQRDPFILSLRAQAFEKSGDSAQATELYRKILTINSHNPTNAFARPVAKQKLAGAKAN